MILITKCHYNNINWSRFLNTATIILMLKIQLAEQGKNCVNTTLGAHTRTFDQNHLWRNLIIRNIKIILIALARHAKIGPKKVFKSTKKFYCWVFTCRTEIKNNFVSANCIQWRCSYKNFWSNVCSESFKSFKKLTKKLHLHHNGQLHKYRS